VTFKVFLLMAAMTALFVVGGGALGGATAMLAVLIIAALMNGVVPLAFEPWPVAAPWWSCYAAFRTAPLSLSGRRAPKVFNTVRTWPQPRNLRMRVAASLSALATQRSTIWPSPQRLTLRQ